MPETAAALRASPEQEAREALAAHPHTRALADDAFTVEPGGLSNHAWSVGAGDSRCIVRLSPPDAARLGVDRASECRLLAAVAAAGLAPEVVCCDPARRLLVTRRIDGLPLRREQAVDLPTLAGLAGALRRLHALPVPAGVHRVDFAEQAARLERASDGWRPQDEVLRTKSRFAFRMLAGRRRRPRLCHNDLHHLNLVRAEARLWLVDWEYGGVGDPIFDLASFLCQHDVGPSARAALCSAYGAAEFDDGSLTAACWAFDYVQWLWYRAWPAGEGADPVHAARGAAIEERLHASAPG